MFLKTYGFPAMTGVIDSCTPRRRRLLGDLGHDPRPGDFFCEPPDQEEVMGLASSGAPGRPRVRVQG